MTSTDYGILTGLVKVVGTLISSVVAIGLTWRGRANWEPSEVDIPKGPERVGGLLTAVAVGLIWIRWSDSTHIPSLVNASIGFAIACFVALLVYGFLITTQTYRSENGSSHKKIIGGFTLTKRVQITLKKRNCDLTVQEIFAQHQFDPDKVWTRSSRALAKSGFLTCYIMLTSFGTLALTCVAIVFLLTTPNKTIQIRKEKKPVHIAIVLNGEIYYARQIMVGFESKLDELLGPTVYVPHYESAIGVAEANADAQNAIIFQELIARFPQKPDYLVTIGTQVSEFAREHYLNEIPIIFIGVTDPIDSKLVRNYDTDPTRGMIAGTLFDPPMSPYVGIFSQTFPGRTFGFVYNPNLYHQDEIYMNRLIAQVNGGNSNIRIVPIPVQSPTLSKDQQNQADIFFGRYYVVKNLQAFITSSRRPFVTASLSNLSMGAIVSISTDTTELGKLSAEQIVVPNLLNGKALAELPIIVPEKTLIGVNLGAARRHNISISPDTVTKATMILN